MKRKLFLIIFFALFFLYILYLQFGRPATIHNITTTKTSEGYACHITIIANKLIIFNKNKLQEYLLQKIQSNSFDNILISKEVLTNITELHVSVYANELMRRLGKVLIVSAYESYSTGYSS